MFKKIMIFLIVTSFVIVSVSASTSEDLQDQVLSLNDALENINVEIDDLTSSAESLSESILLVDTTLSENESDIIEIGKSIEQINGVYDEYFLEYSENLKELKLAIKNSYSQSIADELLISQNLYMSDKEISSIEKIVENGQRISDELNQQMEKTESEKENLQLQLEELISENESLEKEKDSLMAEYSQNENELKELMLTRVNYKSSLEKIEIQLSEEKEKENLSEIAENETAVLTNAQITIFDEYEVLEAMWPVPNFGEEWITSFWGDGRDHKGIDIAANYGEEVVASESGYVEEVYASSSWGNNILISHNNIYQTRYAHLSGFAVEVGDYVEQGQVIGYIGSTGNSTGNHLHYEIYFMGERVDPYPYLS
ncbi:MAG: peptidoglycan DD-metalloendopeptidase family protein [Clostridia bacterium]